jgi:hypothetical protein
MQQERPFFKATLELRRQPRRSLGRRRRDLRTEPNEIMSAQFNRSHFPCPRGMVHCSAGTTGKGRSH